MCYTLRSRSDTLLEAPRSHELGMMPQIRLFLLQVYERHPDVNTSEKQMLSRATGVGVATIELFCESFRLLLALPFILPRQASLQKLDQLRNHRTMSL